MLSRAQGQVCIYETYGADKLDYGVKHGFNIHGLMIQKQQLCHYRGTITAIRHTQPYIYLMLMLMYDIINTFKWQIYILKTK